VHRPVSPAHNPLYIYIIVRPAFIPHVPSLFRLPLSGTHLHPANLSFRPPLRSACIPLQYPFTTSTIYRGFHPRICCIYYSGIGPPFGANVVSPKRANGNTPFAQSPSQIPPLSHTSETHSSFNKNANSATFRSRPPPIYSARSNTGSARPALPPIYSARCINLLMY